jgi:tetratricopeptide (TPR) repeat protein
MKDIHLKEFVEKLNVIQQERKEKPLSQEEMKIIAESLGMNEQDWRAVRETFQAHLARASSFLKHENWEDAITELEQALILQRNDENVLYGLALAYMNRWREYHKKQDNERAENFVRQVLQHYPQNAQAARLLSDFRKEEKVYSNKKRQQTIVSVLSFGAVFIALSIMFLLVFKKTTEKTNAFQDSTTQNVTIMQKSDTTPLPKEVEPIVQDAKKEITQKDTPKKIQVEEDGSKSVSVQWIENELSEGINFQADEANLDVYPESFSLKAKIRIVPINQEVSFLKLKFEWLDKEGNVLFEKNDEIITNYGATVRPKDCETMRHLIYQEGKRPDVHKLRCSILQIEKQPAPKVYEASPALSFTWVGKQPSNVDLEIRERLSTFNEVSLLKELHHKLHLEIQNTGSIALKTLKLNVDWFDNQDKVIQSNDLYITLSDEPVIKPNETRVKSTYGVFKKMKVEDVKGYKVKVLEVSY